MDKFRGKLELRMSLLDLVQFISIAGKEGKLLVRSGAEIATIFFRSGRVIHAESGSATGASVFYKIALWEEGEFLFAEVSVDCEVTVREDLPSLLLEAARLKDEKYLSNPSVDSHASPNVELTPIQLAYKRLLHEAEETEDSKICDEKKRISHFPRVLLLLFIGLLTGLLLLIWFLNDFKIL